VAGVRLLVRYLALCAFPRHFGTLDTTAQHSASHNMSEHALRMHAPRGDDGTVRTPQQYTELTVDAEFATKYFMQQTGETSAERAERLLKATDGNFVAAVTMWRAEQGLPGAGLADGLGAAALSTVMGDPLTMLAGQGTDALGSAALSAIGPGMSVQGTGGLEVLGATALSAVAGDAFGNPMADLGELGLDFLDDDSDDPKRKLYYAYEPWQSQPPMYKVTQFEVLSMVCPCFSPCLATLQCVLGLPIVGKRIFAGLGPLGFGTVIEGLKEPVFVCHPKYPKCWLNTCGPKCCAIPLCCRAKCPDLIDCVECKCFTSLAICNFNICSYDMCLPMCCGGQCCGCGTCDQLMKCKCCNNVTCPVSTCTGGTCPDFDCSCDICECKFGACNLCECINCEGHVKPVGVECAPCCCHSTCTKYPKCFPEILCVREVVKQPSFLITRPEIGPGGDHLMDVAGNEPPITDMER
jgi:hypothetical protein